MMPPPVSPAGASLAAPAPVQRPVERTGSGSAEKCTGSGSVPDVPPGCPLPALAGIQWEGKKDRPGWYCWHAPAGVKAHRNTKTYLGYVGKRKLAEWAALPDARRLATVAAWVAYRRKEKGSG